jgi:hypothetical protein
MVGGCQARAERVATTEQVTSMEDINAKRASRSPTLHVVDRNPLFSDQGHRARELRYTFGV